LLECLNDFSVDKRGDIGCLVRSAAMQSIISVLKLHHASSRKLQANKHVYPFIRKLLE
jgi:tubulin-specific chaperone D